MGAPFILTVLSEDGYQVFAALHREFETLDRAIDGAKTDYLKRYGGNPSFRVYHTVETIDASGFRHTLIEVCFDETKRRSYVALYKVLQEVEPASVGPGPLQASLQAFGLALRRIADQLRRLLPGSRSSGPVLGFR